MLQVSFSVVECTSVTFLACYRHFRVIFVLMLLLLIRRECMRSVLNVN